MITKCELTKVTIATKRERAPQTALALFLSFYQIHQRISGEVPQIMTREVYSSMTVPLTLLSENHYQVEIKR